MASGMRKRGGWGVGVMPTKEANGRNHGWRSSAHRHAPHFTFARLIMSQTLDKAGEAYWSEVWGHTQLQAPFNPRSKALHDFVWVKLHESLSSFLHSYNTKGQRILEIGCGNSILLPYFSTEYGLQVSGLDYSENGCRQSRAILEREGVAGEVHQGDLFTPPPQLLGQFDFVCSFGVAEHFTDTADALKHMAAFLKPGGILITEIPNLSGWMGAFLKRWDRPTYDIHVPMNLPQFLAAHQQAQLPVLHSHYMSGASFNINLDNSKEPVKNYWLKKQWILFLSRLCKITWLLEMKLGVKVPGGSLLSPCMFVYARRP